MIKSFDSLNDWAKEGKVSIRGNHYSSMQKCRCFPDHTCEEAYWWGVEAEGEAVGSSLRPALVVSCLFSSRWVAFYIECKTGWAQKKGHPACLISSVKAHPSTYVPRVSPSCMGSLYESSRYKTNEEIEAHI